MKHLLLLDTIGLSSLSIHLSDADLVLKITASMCVIVTNIYVIKKQNQKPKP